MVGQRTQFDLPASAEELDAYRTLQLLPTAPHDLVEQAYWVLVSRTRARGSNSSSLGRLNDAYATLINPDRRASYDLEHNLTKLRARPKIEMPRRPMFSRKPRFKTRLTHYQLLDIDFDALPEVVDTAYVFHKAHLRRSDPRSTYIRALLEDAYTTLSNPPSRAVYDDKVAPRRHKAGAVPTPAVEPAPPPPAQLFPERVEPVIPEPLVADVETAPVAPQAALPQAAQPHGGPGGVGRWLRGVFGSRAGAAEKHEVKSQRDLRADAHELVMTAEQRRFADLGLLAEPLPDQAPRPILGRARFRFIEGPQAGQTIGLTEHSLILGASDAADVVLENPDGMIGAGHVRVWRREDEYILHQLDSFSTTYVNGERLDLRLAILERGDEIRIGAHTLIFDEVPIEEAEPATVQA
jgi:type III secretion system (T3SS) inner membrane Yop/YscD-like protein